jgi:hypothetical protein
MGMPKNIFLSMTVKHQMSFIVDALDMVRMLEVNQEESPLSSQTPEYSVAAHSAGYEHQCEMENKYPKKLMSWFQEEYGAYTSFPSLTA